VDVIQNKPRYREYSKYLEEIFGHRVQRVSIDAGFTCPNVDGTLARGGCVYCDNRSFTPSKNLGRMDILPQINVQVGKLRGRHGTKGFLAYFQAATNTYADLDRLKFLYDEAVSHPDICGLIISTRPDTVPDEVLDLIESYAERMYVSVEYGLQTIHERSLKWMNRGHGYDSYIDAMNRSRGRKFETSTHVILGLPGETREDMLATAKAVAESSTQAVKIHNLHVVKHTLMARQYEKGEIPIMERGEYVEVVIDFLEQLPKEMVIQRLMGDAPERHMIAPLWTLDKQAFLRAVSTRLIERETWQGRLYDLRVL
jgi:radical SAM protein (TIGR01212 family)